jgi:hypothetical protein
MARFIEELAKQQLWYWLETEKGWEVDGEVNTNNGRIDLAARTPDGKYIGIELKSSVDLDFESTLSEQIQRYMDSKQFDKLYFASPTVEEVKEAVESDNKEPSLPVIREACKSLNKGVANGKYEKQEVLDRINEEVPTHILSFNYAHHDRDVRDYIQRRMEYDTSKESKPITIREGIKQIKSAYIPDEMGVIEVPIPVEEEYMKSPEMALTPGKNNSPKIVVDAESVSRSKTPEFSRDGEPWVRHCTWCKFGGIPEGHIPNVMESEIADRPIDLISFKEVWDPSKIVAGSDNGKIIGIEAKGKTGVESNRTQKQLHEFIETGALSHLYLAIPKLKQESALDLLLDDSVLESSVGLITVNESGVVEIVRDAPSLDLKFDGYKQVDFDGVGYIEKSYKTGYGEVEIPNSEDVHSPFDLSEWRDPLEDDEDQPVVWEDDPRKYVRKIENNDELDLSVPDETREELKQYCNSSDRIRAYLLRGLAAAPYANGKPDDRAPKKGYTRLTLTEFETAEGEYGIDFHFGGGSWEGGYVCFVENQIDDLVRILSSVENLDEAIVQVQGRVIDLSEFEFGYGENYEYKLNGEDARPEQLLPLKITPKETDDGIGVRFQLCEDSKRGVDLVMTETQRMDLLRAIRVARYGRPSEIPGDSGYERIGPDGDDTWDDRQIDEEQHQEDLSVL